MAESIDWARLQKALAVEAQYGFTDLVGQRYRFSEFFSLTLNKPPAALSSSDQQQWRILAAEFDGYMQLLAADRKQLLTRTERLLSTAQNTIAQLVQNPQAASEQRQKLQLAPIVAETTSESTTPAVVIGLD
jgi:ATP-dependent DNA helicase RecG